MGAAPSDLQNDPRTDASGWDLPDFHPPRFTGFGQFDPYILTLEKQADAVRADEMLCIAKQLGQGRAGARRHHVERLRRDFLDPDILDARPGGPCARRRPPETRISSRSPRTSDTSTRSRSKTASTRPGNPAPLPRSAKVPGIGGIKGRKLGAIPDMPVPDIVQGPGGYQIVAGVPVRQQTDIALQPPQCFT